MHDGQNIKQWILKFSFIFIAAWYILLLSMFPKYSPRFLSIGDTEEGLVYMVGLSLFLIFLLSYFVHFIVRIVKSLTTTDAENDAELAMQQWLAAAEQHSIFHVRVLSILSFAILILNTATYTKDGDAYLFTGLFVIATAIVLNIVYKYLFAKLDGLPNQSKEHGPWFAAISFMGLILFAMVNLKTTLELLYHFIAIIVSLFTSEEVEGAGEILFFILMYASILSYTGYNLVKRYRLLLVDIKLIYSTLRAKLGRHPATLSNKT